MPGDHDVQPIGLNDLIDRTVYGADDEEVATVVNVFADLRSRRLLYALLEVGGFVGIGSRRVLVPFDALYWTSDGLYLPVERHHLENAPEWDRASVLDDAYQDEVVRYWKGEATGAMDGPGAG